MKKILFALVFTLILTGCGTGNAEPTVPAKTISKQDAMMEATNAYVTEYLGLDGTSCTLGNQLSAYRLADRKLVTIDYEMYPVFVEDKVVAFTTCTVSDTGEYLPGCGVEFAEAFWQAYSEQPHTPVALVYAQEGAYLVREGAAPILLHKMPVKGCDPIVELDGCRDSLVYSNI